MPSYWKYGRILQAVYMVPSDIYDVPLAIRSLPPSIMCSPARSTRI